MKNTADIEERRGQPVSDSTQTDREPGKAAAPSKEEPASAPGRALLFGSGMFIVAAGAVIWAASAGRPVIGEGQWGVAVFFLAYGVFTILMGYPHPSYGHVSFDRVAQVASILVLGPVAAAIINGVASFAFPFYRLFQGVSLRDVITASLNNAGIMSLIILLCGLAYTALGGPVPLMRLDWHVAGLLLLLMLAMQISNDLLMLALVYLRGGDLTNHFNVFSTVVELSSVLIAVLVAIVFNRMELEVFVLLLAVLSLGMLVLKQFANMRHRLEALVEERTIALHEKTLELERQATHDKLTGLYNRRYADDYLDKAMEEAKRYKHRFTIALADIDYFKEVNDRHSHAKGDAVLKHVAKMLKERCRNTDMIARYGGEEFLLCFPETDSATAAKVCEQLRAAIENEDWSFVAPGVGITLSFGLAECFADFRRKTILSAADSRLYEAKNNGRNRVVA